MRIGIDARFLGAKKNRGLGRYTSELVNGLMKIDKDNEYVLFLSKQAYNKLQDLPPNWRKIKINIPWYTFSEQIKYFFILRKYNLDLIHFPHFNVPFFYRKKIAVTIHDLIMTHYGEDRSTTKNKLIYYFKIKIARFLVSSTARRAKIIFTPSEFSKQDIIKKLGVDKNKIVVTYEGVNLNHSVDFDKEKKIDKPYFFYVGAAYPHKNLQFLISAFEKFNISDKYRLVLAGRKDFFYRRLQKEQLQKNDNVRYLGEVTDKELTSLYKNAIAFVFPSKIEGFGLPPLEAISFDCPVLSSNSSCLPEILANAAIYFDSNKEDELIKALKRITDNNIREKLIQEGKKQISKYSWNKLVEQTKREYEKCNFV